LRQIAVELIYFSNNDILGLHGCYFLREGRYCLAQNENSADRGQHQPDRESQGRDEGAEGKGHSQTAFAVVQRGGEIVIVIRRGAGAGEVEQPKVADIEVESHGGDDQQRGEAQNGQAVGRIENRGVVALVLVFRFA
jgi:hypothetical protein